jgi:hypothetical protein
MALMTLPKDLASLRREDLLALVAERQHQIAELRAEIEQLKRGGKRQAAPCSKYSSSRLSIQLSCCHGRRLGHDLGHGFGRPIERMGRLIPFINKLVNLGSQVVFGFNINDAEACAWPDAEPLFHVIHP